MNLRRQAGWVALATTVVTWASAFPAIETGLTGFSPLALGLARLVVAALALGTVALVARPAVPPRSMWPRVLVAGLLGQTLYQGLLMAGEVSVPAGTASILIATAPLFSVLAASWFGDSSRGQWTGMLVSFAGAVLVGISLGLGGGVGSLLVLAAAACQGLYHVVVKPLAESIGAFAATAWSVWAGALLAVPALPSLVRQLPHAPSSAIGAVLFLGVVPSAVGYVAWSFAVARVPIAKSTVALYLVPVVALALAWAWLGEQPTALSLVGGVLAVAGVILVRRPRRVATETHGARADRPRAVGRDVRAAPWDGRSARTASSRAAASPAATER